MSSGGERVVACFDRWLWLGQARGSGEGAWVGAVDAVTGWEVSGLGLWIRFDRVLEAVGGVYPVGADEMNRCLRVSFDRGRGIRFWPEEGLGGFEVVGHLVAEPTGRPGTVAARRVDREVFEGLLERCWDQVWEDPGLSSLSVEFLDAASGEPVDLERPEVLQVVVDGDCPDGDPVGDGWWPEVDGRAVSPEVERFLRPLVDEFGLDGDYLSRWPVESWEQWARVWAALEEDPECGCACAPAWMESLVGRWRPTDFMIPFPCVGSLSSGLDWFALGREHGGMRVVADYFQPGAVASSEELEEAWRLAGSWGLEPRICMDLVPGEPWGRGLVGAVDAWGVAGASEEQVDALAALVSRRGLRVGEPAAALAATYGLDMGAGAPLVVWDWAS